MKKIELTANYLETISWLGDKIVDWGAAGKLYSIDGTAKQFYNYHYTGNFNGAINSTDGRYAFIYQKNGTKGLLLKEGKLLREINRSYYCANAYEYPAAFASVNNSVYLIHCPVSYDQLDFEDVETGELVTNISGRKSPDIFHSRLEISPDGTYLINKGWLWHPLDHIQTYHIKDCLNNPKLLDGFDPVDSAYGAEFCTASFINDKTILMGSSAEVFDDEIADPPIKSIGVWDIETKQLSTPVKVKAEFGNLFAISKDLAWDMYQYPKIININTGEIIAKDEEINSGNQQSAIFNHSTSPQIIFNYQTKNIAISGNEKIYVLIP